jgi:dGTPase
MSVAEHEARYLRDRDRLLGSPAFRRLAGKTQVVALPNDPLVRTRLTHTLEVSSMAREMGRGLGLVDPLIDAIALGHDLGHPAFGHAGERALALLVPGGFHHAAHGVRVVTELEPGLDLAPEIVEGILKHSKGRGGAIFARGAAMASMTREALVVRAADLFAYACHDLDDAYLVGALRPTDVPRGVAKILGTEAGDLRRVLLGRTVQSSLRRGDVSLDAEVEAALQDLRTFLYEGLYEAPRIARQTSFVRSLFSSLWEIASEQPRNFEAALRRAGLLPARQGAPHEQFVDAMAAMTDRQVLQLGRVLRLPRKARSLPQSAPSPS